MKILYYLIFLEYILVKFESGFRKSKYRRMLIIWIYKFGDNNVLILNFWYLFIFKIGIWIVNLIKYL